MMFSALIPAPISNCKRFPIFCSTFLPVASRSIRRASTRPNIRSLACESRFKICPCASIEVVPATFNLNGFTSVATSASELMVKSPPDLKVIGMSAFGTPGAPAIS